MGTKPKPDPEKYCAHCGARLARKRFGREQVLESMNMFLRRRFCGQACSGLGLRKSAPSRSALLKRIASMKKPFCEGCGTSEKLSIHHKDRDWRNNDPSNLATLCSSCHTSLHHRAGDINPPKPRPPCRLCGKPSRYQALCNLHIQRKKKHGDPRLTSRWLDGSWKLVVDTTTVAGDV